MNNFKQDARLYNQALRTQRLVLEASINFNATPADKVQGTDIAGAALLRTEGLTAAADAVEDISSLVTTPADTTGIFALLIDTAMNPPEKIYSVKVTPSSGSISVESADITPGGRIAIDLDSSLDLSANDLTMVVEVEYREKV